MTGRWHPRMAPAFTFPKPVRKKEVLLNVPLIRIILNFRDDLVSDRELPSMRITFKKMSSAARQLGSLMRFKRQDEGSTAVEFAIVSTPFLMFIFALIGCAYYFFVMSSIEKGMDQSSRLIRTGQAVSENMTVDQFKQAICNGAGQWIKCAKMQIFVKHYTDWSTLNSDTPQPCVDTNKNVITNTAPGSSYIATYSGTASDVVIVTACYKWDFTSKLPFFTLGNMTDGSLMMQTATAFRTEPFPNS
jgi:Flp pilus assembly protein TadG